MPAVTRGGLGCRYSPSSSSRQTAMQRSCLHSMAGGVPKTRRSLFPVQRDPAGTAPGLLSPAAALSSCGLVGVQAFEITHSWGGFLLQGLCLWRGTGEVEFLRFDFPVFI